MPPIIHSIHFVTVLAMLSGMLLIIFGSIGLANEGTTYDMLFVVEGLKNAMGTTFSIMPYIEGIAIYMVVLGAVITLIHLKGTAVVVLKRNKIIRAFLVLLIGGIIAETGLIIYASVWSIYDDYALAQIKPNMLASLEVDYIDAGTTANADYVLSTKVSTSSWEKMQFQTSCCGVLGPDDYKNFAWNSNLTYNGSVYLLTYPVSCCALKQPVADFPNGVIPISSFVDFQACLNDSVAGNAPAIQYPCSLYMQDFVYQFSLISIILSSILIFLKIMGVVIIIVGLKNLGPD